MKKLFSSTIFKLIIAVIIGDSARFVANENFMNFVVTENTSSATDLLQGSTYYFRICFLLDRQDER